ncbi:Enoyl-CoA hydratase/carnithine racemase [Cognatiyoonia koreensis]|uniref:Enoyl-CoA hydratase domain-containing protein 3, mitochondrial n=2 Tax=Cognatiyoonia koreensis TaxID=364200 RepID=A0A1I0PAG6_9RHOB|nr:Enoyl-CoA hydratase/carnithine racemase [Cognatiyoonia koreensis]
MTILKRADAEGIAHLTLNMPEKLNALSDAMIARFHALLDKIADDPTVKVVIVSGAGKAFCAGHDLGEMRAKDAEALKDLFDRCAALMLAIHALPQPIIAQVHGIATAAGCQLVATCDLAVAAEDTRFGVNGVNIGLFCSTPMVALTRNIGRKAAFEMLTTGRFISAEEAVTMGLVNKAVPPDMLQQKTRELAAMIAAKRTAAVKLGKETFYRQADMDVASAYEFAGDAMVRNMAIPDTQEGIAAFLEKRAPKWD